MFFNVGVSRLLSGDFLDLAVKEKGGLNCGSFGLEVVEMNEK